MTSGKTTSVIVAGARTPVGKLMGSLKDFSGSDLGGFAIKGALDKAGVKGEDVDYVIMGQVLTAGAGQMPARQAAVAAGDPFRWRRNAAAVRVCSRLTLVLVAVYAIRVVTSASYLPAPAFNSTGDSSSTAS